MPLSAAALTFPASPSFPCSDATPHTRHRGRRRDPSSAMAAPRLHLATAQSLSLTARPCQARQRRREEQRRGGRRQRVRFDSEKRRPPRGTGKSASKRRRRRNRRKKLSRRWPSPPVHGRKQEGREKKKWAVGPSRPHEPSQPAKPHLEPARQAGPVSRARPPSREPRGPNPSRP